MTAQPKKKRNSNEKKKLLTHLAFTRLRVLIVQPYTTELLNLIIHWLWLFAGKYLSRALQCGLMEFQWPIHTAVL